MPNSPPTLALILEMYRQHKTPFDLFLLVLAGVFVRIFYWGGKLREACGDVLIGTTIMIFVAARVPNIVLNLPEIGAVTVNHNELAFVIGMLGYKGFKEVAFWVLKKRFGIDVQALRQKKQESNQ
ncbi:hypothetical protein ABKE32_000480 [Escherichia albertii]|uniref:hypothetical protein n=1 Tax=Escherichia albertii TaxID=208962 RepID=UPI0007443ADE|nr:hypothetical protein [Escherichia albertii]